MSSVRPARSRADAPRTRSAHPENSCPNVTGTASCRCVRPGFTTPAYCFAFSSIALASLSSSSQSGFVSSSAARRMAVGVASFVDCAMFTSSFGFTCSYVPSPPPQIWFARLAMTSFTFMWNETPAPEWKTSTTN